MWVIDGRPQYHLDGCAKLEGVDGIEIPWAQATEDGFVPCDVCRPDERRLGRSPPRRVAAAPAEQPVADAPVG